MIRLACLAALVLAGCASDPDASGDATPADPDPTAEARPDTTPEAPAGIMLEMDGLSVVDFGATMEEATAALAAISGEPSETGESPECGAGPLTYASWESGLMIYGSEGEFAGWFLSDGAAMADFATPEDITLGSTRADLEAAYTADVFESTLGDEFIAVEVGGDPEASDAWIAGLLTGAGPDAEVDVMWAGVSCSFR